MNPLLDYFSRLLAERAKPEQEDPGSGEGSAGVGRPGDGRHGDLGSPAGAGRQLAGTSGLGGEPEELTSVGILLVLRRMRVPIIVLIVIFAVSVLGLTLIPGRDAAGDPARLGFFDAFYFMSFTATTIGFGEIPYAFTPDQRLWVTLSIFMSVIGWAYAVGSLLALVQDRVFRRALARRLFARKVSHLGAPFVLLVGYGDTGQRIARSLDEMGRRFVVLERDEDRVAAIDLDAYRADIPALRGDARSTANLTLAGLGYPDCEGVLALSGSNEVNLDVAMTTALVRPGLPVIAQTTSREVGDRMSAFGAPEVINPLDRFGDHLRILHRSPAAYQLMTWLTSAPGTPLPARRPPLARGRWVVCGHSAFSGEVVADLRAEGLAVTVVDGDPVPGSGARFDDALLGECDLGSAVSFVAASDNDMTNLWLLQAARRINPGLFVVARQNRPGNLALYDAVAVDFAMVRADVVAHEVVARLANPSLMRFLPRVPKLGDAWAVSTVDALVSRCGTGTPDLWTVHLTADDAPALTPWLGGSGTDVEGAEDVVRGLRLGDLMRAPHGREDTLPVVVLGMVRGDEVTAGPHDDTLLQRGDRLLLAGRPMARRQLEATLFQDTTAAYVLEDRVVPSSWLWRRLAR